MAAIQESNVMAPQKTRNNYHVIHQFIPGISKKVTTKNLCIDSKHVCMKYA